MASTELAVPKDLRKAVASLKTSRWTEDPASVRPMLATLADPPLAQPGLIYEPKYDGIRALVDLRPEHPERAQRAEPRPCARLPRSSNSPSSSTAKSRRWIGAGVLLAFNICKDACT
jgi:hypothetical protein